MKLLSYEYFDSPSIKLIYIPFKTMKSIILDSFLDLRKQIRIGFFFPELYRIALLYIPCY